MFRLAGHGAGTLIKPMSSAMQKDFGTVSENERTISSTLIAGAMLLGLLSPATSEVFFPYLFHFLFMVVVFSFCTLNTNVLTIVSVVERSCWIALTWQMACIPALVTAMCFLMNTDLVTTSVLIATTTAGSVFASPALAHLVGLDRGMAIRTMMLSTFLMPVSLLFFGELNGIITSDLSLFRYLQHVVYFLLVPMVIAVAYWEALPSLPGVVQISSERVMHWCATLALMGFCVGVMSKLHGSSEKHYDQLIHYILLVAATVITIYAITGLLFSHLGRKSALTVGMLAANRNVALSFALISDVLPRDVLVFIAVAQFPIFLSPIAVRLYQASNLSLPPLQNDVYETDIDDRVRDTQA